MDQSLDDQIEQLHQTIAALEDLRESFGEAVVEKARAPLEQRLEELLRQQQASQPAVPYAPEEQRKQVSVLCADLAGFTALSTELDPEELREIQQAYFEAVTPPIEERGGVVEKYIGDAVLAVFGLPQAREDDPERAVRAALEMQSALEGLNQEKEGDLGFPLQMRVGVSTGMVLATMKGEGDFVVTGETVNLASRLQSLAPAGGVLILHDTYRHLRGIFDVSPKEAVQVKGFTEPVSVYQVLQAKPRAFRTLARGVEGIETPLVGRQTELKTLQDTLLGAIEEREGQVVTISGEAGVGKSRLLYEFQNWFELLPQRVRLFQGKARQEAQGLPFGLLRDLFAFRFQILDDDRVEQVWRKLEAGFREVFGSAEGGKMRAHILGQLLGYDFSLSPHLERVICDAEQLRNRGLMYLLEYFKGLCEQGAVVVILEDLHWADDSSLDAINRLGEQVAHLSLMIVGAARHALLERRPYWGEGLPYHHFIELQPLSKRESRQLVGEILKLVEVIPPELRQLVVEGGEGNPFYIEELIKMLVESGVIIKGEQQWRVEVQRLEQLTVPATLAGVLQARLDSLPVEERAVLQEASVVGRLFWDRVVAYIHASQFGASGEKKVPLALSALRGRELVYRREDSAFADSREYLFKHDILREVTYQSVLKRMRRAYHTLAADWLIENCGERIGEYRGLIAEHLLLAGRKEQALEYLAAAAETALAAYANSEAESFYRRCLELLPDESLKADLLAGLGEALRRQGRHEEGQKIFRKGIELYRQLGKLDRAAYLYAFLSGLLWQVDYLQAWQACQEGMEVLKGASDSQGLAYLLTEAGRTAYFTAQPPELVVSLCQQAMEMAGRSGAVEVQADALITLGIQSKDILQGIHLIEQAVVMIKEMGPSITAARAHTNLGYAYDYYIIDLNIGLQNRLRSAEICRQIGDIDTMFFSLEGAANLYAEMGILNFLPELEKEYVRNSTALQEQIETFVGKDSLVSTILLFYLGEWHQARFQFHALLEDYRKTSKLQYIAEGNIYLFYTLLELNCFAGLSDLSEAETAVEEMLEFGSWYLYTIPYFRVINSARQARLEEARTLFANASVTQCQPENNRMKADRLLAEAELAQAEKSTHQLVSASQSLIEIFKAAGSRWWWARELIRLGDALRGRGEPGDLQRSRQTYQQSLEMFTEMGAPGYIAVLEKRLQDIESIHSGKSKSTLPISS